MFYCIFYFTCGRSFTEVNDSALDAKLVRVTLEDDLRGKAIRSSLWATQRLLCFYTRKRLPRPVVNLICLPRCILTPCPRWVSTIVLATPVRRIVVRAGSLKEFRLVRYSILDMFEAETPRRLIILLQDAYKTDTNETIHGYKNDNHTKLAVWLSVGRDQQVTLRRARLTLGWVTVCGQVHNLGLWPAT